MPAILKGFIERVFVAGFAYENTPRGLDGKLTGKAWIITTHNTPKIVLPLVQDYSKVLKFQVLNLAVLNRSKLPRFHLLSI